MFGLADLFNSKIILCRPVRVSSLAAAPKKRDFSEQVQSAKSDYPNPNIIITKHEERVGSPIPTPPCDVFSSQNTDQRRESLVGLCTFNRKFQMFQKCGEFVKPD